LDWPGLRRVRNTAAQPNEGVQATAVTFRSTAAPDARRSAATFSKLAISALLKQCVLLCYNTGRRHIMTTPLLELEGTWAEITAQIPDFAGQKLRVLVYPAEENRTTAPETRPIAEILAEIAATIPAAELAKLPPDFTDQLDHYTYGTPKR
jgi:hypothetical protein